MAAIEVLSDGERIVCLGGAEYSAITFSLISLPNRREPSLEIFGVRDEEPRIVTRTIKAGALGGKVTVRCVRDDAGCSTDTQQLVTGDDRSPGNADEAICGAESRAGRFSCEIETPLVRRFSFVVSADGTFQLTLQYHFANETPQLSVGCTNEGSESWCECALPFGDAARLSFASRP